ncbi:MAG: hypothetical protein IPK17_04565 [Chloroflexi bacterium]|uniref:hypothetical protein n=1 Tax=Candidatus Flexifilum breve TaxID=3140694 RepID=UPI0031368A06|nr:hypothetical protein [Chloroflexota bacterium]
MRYLRPIDNLPILPKNSRSYLTLLLELLQWISEMEAREEKASYHKYRAWAYDHFAAVETHAKDYQQLATRLGLITTRSR